VAVRTVDPDPGVGFGEVGEAGLDHDVVAAADVEGDALDLRDQEAV
jgi:hypothetical protein